jgi:integrase
MPKKVKNLTAMEIKRLIKPGRHAVGNIPGLLLFVKDTGTRSWIYRTMYGAKRLNIGLGGYPKISLAKAKERALEADDLIKKGISPIDQKKSIKAAIKVSQDGKITFMKAARQCHDMKSSEFKNFKHGKQWISTLEKYAFPVIGRMNVDEIDLPHILQVLEPIWQEKTETATRLRQRIEAVLTWATVSKYRQGDNPARWQGNLAEVLPKPNKIKTVKHMPALPYKEINSFMTALREIEGMGARALEIIILTACRSSECRKATWDEIDFQERTWIVPAERMKAGKEHRIPLTNDAIKLLNNLPRFEGSNYIFSAPKGGPISDMTISAVCRRMQLPIVPHGFRSTFRDWAAETTNFPREVCEQALAHTLDSKVEAAYRRGDLFNKRVKLMESWNDYINKKPDESAKVIQIRAEVAK